MKVIWTLMNQASGKLAGVVAANNRGGDYLRSRVIGANPRGAQQSRIRAILAGLAAAWRSTLTQVQRDAWNLLGDTTITGENAFCACNCILLQGGGTRVTAAPASRGGTFTPFVHQDTATPTAGGISVTDAGNLYWNPANATDDYNSAAGGVINFYVSKVQAPSRGAQQFPFSWLASKVRGGSATAGVQTQDTGQTLVAGQIVYVRVTSVGLDGKLATPQELRIIVGTE